jgi:hypothetical protein
MSILIYELSFFFVVENDNPRSADSDPSSALDSNELIRQLLP